MFLNFSFKKKLFKLFKKINRTLNIFGIDLRKISRLSFKSYLLYHKQKREWLKQGGVITEKFMIIDEYKGNAGISSGHYFHQDLLVAKLIFDANPKRHLDIGSRIDGFVAHVASFREIEVVDIREQKKSIHKNIKFSKGNFMIPQNIKKTDSLSCLHAIEHFGLGRYSDPINKDGHIIGINNLIKLIKKNGYLYISFPIGNKDQVFFNAHRVFHPLSIFKYESIYKNMRIKRFDYVDDSGQLHLKSDPKKVKENLIYGCGIYTFQKIT